MTKYTLKQAARTLETKILDLVVEAVNGKIPYVIEEERAYFSQEAIDAYRTALQPEELKGEEPGKEEAELVAEREKKLAAEREEAQQRKEDEKWRAAASIVLGKRKLGQYLNRYEPEEVKRVITNITRCIGEERASLLFKADVKGQIMKQLQNGKLNPYLGQLAALCYQAKEAFGDSIPVEYNIERVPDQFLPGRIGRLANKLEEEIDRTAMIEENKEVIAACLKLGYERRLIENVLDEGYNPLYLHALFKKGLKVGTNDPRIGENYMQTDDCRSDVESALQKVDVPYVKKVLESEIRKLNRDSSQLGSQHLIRFKKRKQCIRMSSQWAEITTAGVREMINYIIQTGNCSS